MRSDGRPPGRRGCPCDADGGAYPTLGAPATPRRHGRSSRRAQCCSSSPGGNSQTISPAQRRRRGWLPGSPSFGGALSRAALALCALWSALQPAAGQPLGNSISPTSVVSTSSFFASSLAAGPPYNTLLIVRGTSPGGNEISPLVPAGPLGYAGVCMCVRMAVAAYMLVSAGCKAVLCGFAPVDSTCAAQALWR